MELITINSTYPEEYLKVFAKHNIKFPVLDEIVKLERWEKLPRINKVGFFVKPYTQQFIEGEIMGVKGSKELSFDSKRFTTLLGEELTMEMLEEFKKQEKQERVLVKPLKKENIYDN